MSQLLENETPRVLNFQRDKGTKGQKTNTSIGILAFGISILISSQMPNAKMPIDVFVFCPFVSNSEMEYIPNIITQSKMRPFTVDHTLLSRNSYCDTSGIRQNGIHYNISAVKGQLCRVTDNSCVQ